MCDLSETLQEKRIVDFTDEELKEARFMGDGVSRPTTALLDEIRSNVRLHAFTGYVFYCMVTSTAEGVPQPLRSPTNSDSSILTKVSAASDDATLVNGEIISPFERKNYYNGVCANRDGIPELYYRSNLDKIPFPVPPPGAKWHTVPVKTAEPLSDPVLTRELWGGIVAPKIITVLDAHGINYASLKMARFATIDETTKAKVYGPKVAWIATHPDSTTPDQACAASPAILDVFEVHGVVGVVVEWYEATIKRLAGTPLMHQMEQTNPTYNYRHPYTANLSLSITSKSHSCLQGTAGLYFHAKHRGPGKPENQVFAITNHHVVRADDEEDYEDHGDRERDHVYLMSVGSYNDSLERVKARIHREGRDIIELECRIHRLQTPSKSTHPDIKLDRMEALGEAKKMRKKHWRALTTLKAFRQEISSQWRDKELRCVGHVDYAPSISASIDSRTYTRDLATISLDPWKFQDAYNGNVVDIGNEYTGHALDRIFWPDADEAEQSGPVFPDNGMFSIHGAVTEEDLTTSAFGFVVGKVGHTTGFTFGRYSMLDAYINERGVRSIEAVIYNYSDTSKNFSRPGDSGSAIFAGDGRFVALLHSGELKNDTADTTHVTYGTPAYFVIEQLKARYPDADFDQETFPISTPVGEDSEEGVEGST